jgi:DNA-binding NtrC family response regulator
MPSAELTGTSVLIVDDEVLLRKQIAAALERFGADVTQSGDLDTTRRVIADLNFDFALLDVNLPDGRGTELLKESAFSANTSVIVMTAEADVGTAVEAMKLGAVDFLSKPFEPSELPLVFRRVKRVRQTERAELHRRNETARNRPEFYFGKALAPLELKIRKILAADTRMGVETSAPPVLIEGETGTGKTTIARWIHERQPLLAADLKVLSPERRRHMDNPGPILCRYKIRRDDAPSGPCRKLILEVCVQRLVRRPDQVAADEGLYDFVPLR